MKIQDILFLVILIILIFKKSPKMLVGAGLVCLLLSMPLFSLWIFFTAEHLVWYAAGVFLLAIFFLLTKHPKL